MKPACYSLVKSRRDIAILLAQDFLLETGVHAKMKKDVLEGDFSTALTP